MKLTLIGHDHRYAVEQMVLMLLPGTVFSGDGPDGDTGEVTLEGDAALARFTLSGKTYTGRITRSELGLDRPRDQKAVEQHLVKLAVYRALLQHTGNPPWGALSGVRPAKLVTRWLESGLDSVQCADLLTGLYGLDRSKATLAIRCAQESRQVSQNLAPGDLSLYIGIPFCPTRCAYCSFISADVKGSLALVEPYVDALCRELAWAGDFLKRRGLRLRSVYMGGGTPTTLTPGQLDRVLSALTAWTDPAALEEFTVEAGRPDTITPEKLDVLLAHGVDRVSVNPQTLSDEVLRAMGRAHTAQQFRDAYALAQARGFAINTDLIAGLPGDSPDGFRATLDELLALAPADVTIHTLSLKHGSHLFAGGGTHPLPDGPAVAQMLDYAAQALPRQGYHPYYLYRQKQMTGSLENVGWTCRAQGSFYNVVMMEELHSVLALGSGGVTKLIDRPAGRITRHTNPKYPKEYLERLPEILSQREELQWPST